MNQKHMKRCLELALMGKGQVSSNPLVGCVIVKNNEVIAEAFHQKYGGPHAEVNAIQKLPANFNFSDCTLYVNLEPCSHHGKTPPCSDLIISKKFKEVVVGTIDPNPLVAGRGLVQLSKAGIKVTSGILEDKCREINKRFFTFHEKKRPYIILKWAQTSNGHMSRWPLSDKREDNWITCSESNLLVHEWRAEEEAIMVGTNTVIYDNPELTVRWVKGKNPIRVIIDKNLKLSSSLHVFNDAAPTLIFNQSKTKIDNNLHYFKINPINDFTDEIFRELYKLSISSVLVEGGAKLLNSLIAKNYWDEARIFINPSLEFRNGLKAPFLPISEKPTKSGTDLLYIIKNNNASGIIKR